MGVYIGKLHYHYREQPNRVKFCPSRFWHVFHLLQQSQNFPFPASEGEWVITGNLASFNMFLRPPSDTGSAGGVKLGKKVTRKRLYKKKYIPKILGNKHYAQSWDMQHFRITDVIQMFDVLLTGTYSLFRQLCFALLVHSLNTVVK